MKKTLAAASVRPNPSLEQTSTGMALGPRGRAVYHPPRGPSASPAGSAQLKRKAAHALSGRRRLCQQRHTSLHARRTRRIAPGRSSVQCDRRRERGFASSRWLVLPVLRGTRGQCCASLFTHQTVAHASGPHRACRCAGQSAPLLNLVHGIRGACRFGTAVRLSGKLARRASGDVRTRRTCFWPCSPAVLLAKSSAQSWKCSLTPRSSGPPPAWHLGRDAPWSMLRLAAQAPRRRRPLSSNVRPRSAPCLRTSSASRTTRASKSEA